MVVVRVAQLVIGRGREEAHKCKHAARCLAVRSVPSLNFPHKTYPGVCLMWTEIGPLVVSVMGASDRYSVRYGADR